MLNTLFDDGIRDVRLLLERYFSGLPEMRVKSDIRPGEVLQKLPEMAPQKGEPLEAILRDVEEIIIPGLTHWQHPGFMALFPSNTSLPSFLGEMVTAGLGVNCMMWDTSPSAAELEQRVLQWIGTAMHLPAHWQGSIQDTASTATLTAVVAAREKALGYNGMENGLQGQPTLVMYTSTKAHFSVEKAARIAGIGSKNLRRIPVGKDRTLDTDALANAIAEDKTKGYLPFMVVATCGTTGTLAFDPVDSIASICKKHGLWLHVDAAYAGNTFILDEYRHLSDDIKEADSYVFNPHKWLFTHFDCSLFYVANEKDLLRVFSADSDYLKASREGIRNYKDWGLPLGRRFRALKLWFVLRHFGIEGISARLREHIRLARILESKLRKNPNWEFVTEPAMNVLVVRWNDGRSSQQELDRMNQQLIESINRDGRFYLSGTRVDGKFVLRIVPAQTNVEESHIDTLHALMESISLVFPGDQ
jgi:aromatic-L-amino-acid decarboxylase